MQPHVKSFAAALEDALPCIFTEIEPDHLATVLAGSDTVIDLDAEALRLDVSTPVAGAHDGLPAETLQDLLGFNFPNDLTRGSFLAGGRGAGQLALTASLPLAATSAEAACDAILDQIAAALALGERIAGRQTRGFSQGASDVT